MIQCSLAKPRRVCFKRRCSTSPRKSGRKSCRIFFTAWQAMRSRDVKRETRRRLSRRNKTKADKAAKINSPDICLPFFDICETTTSRRKIKSPCSLCLIRQTFSASGGKRSASKSSRLDRAVRRRRERVRMWSKRGSPMETDAVPACCSRLRVSMR